MAVEDGGNGGWWELRTVVGGVSGSGGWWVCGGGGWWQLRLVAVEGDGLVAVEVEGN